MNDEGVCRTAPATQGLLINHIKHFMVKNDTFQKKSRIRETKNFSTDADSRTDTILERLLDLSNIYIYIYFFFWDKSCNLSKIVSVLLSASVKRFFVSRMQDFHRIGPLGRFDHRVAMSACMFVWRTFNNEIDFLLLKNMLFRTWGKLFLTS